MPRRKPNPQHSSKLQSVDGGCSDEQHAAKKAKPAVKTSGLPSSPNIGTSSKLFIPVDNAWSNKSLDALFHITDLELQNISKNTSSSEVKLETVPTDDSASANYHQVVRLPGHEKGVEKYQLKSDSLEEQGLKLVYTKRTHDQYQPNPISYGSYRPRGFKEQGGATSPQLVEVTVGRKRKHPPKPGRHICPYCQRGCAKPSVLQKHIRAHTGERPYPCIPCGFSFKTKSNLYKHCKSRAHAVKVGQSPNFEEAKFCTDDITDSEENGSSTDTDGEMEPVVSAAVSKAVTALPGGVANMIYKSDKAYYDIIPAPSEHIPSLDIQQEQKEEEARLHTPPPEPTEATTALRQLEDMSDEIAVMAANANVAVTSSVQTLPDKLVRVTIQLQKHSGTDNQVPGNSETTVEADVTMSSSSPAILTTHSITKPVDHKLMSTQMLHDRIQQLIMENQAIVDTVPMVDPPRHKRLSRQNSETTKADNNSPNIVSPVMDSEQKCEQSFLDLTEASGRPPDIDTDSSTKLTEEMSFPSDIKINLKLPKPVQNMKCPNNPEGSAIKDLLLKGDDQPPSQISRAIIKGMSTVGQGDSISRTVDNYGPYLCKPCNVSFRKEGSLHMHQKFYCPASCKTSISLQAEREREILNKHFPDVPATPVGSTKFSYNKNVVDSTVCETPTEISSPKRKGRPKGAKTKPKPKEQLNVLQTPVHLSGNLTSPMPSGGTVIQMSGPPLSNVYPVGPVITNVSPNATIIPVCFPSTNMLKRSFSVPTTVFSSSPVPTYSESQLVSMVASTAGSIHSKIETIISNTSSSMTQTSATTATSSLQPIVKQEAVVSTTTSSRNLWKLQLRGKLLMKRSMSVERMLSDDTDKSPTPTKLMSHPNLMCPLPPEAPRLMRSITMDSIPISAVSSSEELKKSNLKTIKGNNVTALPSVATLASSHSTSINNKPNNVQPSPYVFSTSTRVISPKPVASACIPLAQAGTMPMVPSIIQGGLIRMSLLPTKSLETLTLPTSQGASIVLPPLALSVLPPYSMAHTDKTEVSSASLILTGNESLASAAVTATSESTSTAIQEAIALPSTEKQDVSVMLAGHNLASLRSSTHVTFCCVQQSQPMYVQQGSSRKTSMYSNWRVAAYNPNPHGLTARMLFSLYSSRQYPSDPINAISKVASSQPGSLTHSSYWNYYNKLKAIQSWQKSGSDGAKMPVVLRMPSDVRLSSDDIKGIMHTTGSSKCKDITIPREKKRMVAGGYKSNDIYVYIRGRGRGKYVCEECGIRCKKPSMLKKHIRTHTDLRPYSCKHCNFSFKTKGNLTKHMKSKAHHKKCTELGIIPVPTAVHDSQIDNEALERQQEISRESKILEDEEELKARKAELIKRGISVDEDEDDDEDDDEESDDESDEEESELVINEDEAAVFKENDSKYSREKFLGESSDSRKVIVMQVADSHRGLVPAPGTGVTNPLLVSPDNASVNKAVLQRQAIDAEIARSLLDLSKQATDHTTSQEEEPHTDDANKNVRLGNLISSLMFRSQDSAVPPPNEERTLPLNPRKRKSDDLPFVTSEHKRLYSSMNETSSFTSQSAWPLTPLTSGVLFQQTSTRFAPPVILPGQGPIIGQLISTMPASSCSHTFPFQFMHPFSRVSTSSLSDDKQQSPRPILPTTSDQPVNLCVKDENKSSQGQSAVMSPVEDTSPMSTNPNSQVFFVTTENRAPYEIHPIPGKVVEDSKSVVDGKYVCGICRKSFSKQHQLTLHKNIHFFESPYKCSHCALSFRTEAQLERHLLSETHSVKHSLGPQYGGASVDNPRPYRCEDCKIAFRIPGHLAKHLRSKMHIVALEKLDKLPVGTYEKIQRNAIDLKDCDTIESLRAVIASEEGKVRPPSDLSDSQESDGPPNSDRVYAPVFTPPTINAYERNSKASNERVTVEIKNEPIEMFEVTQHQAGDETIIKSAKQKVVPNSSQPFDETMIKSAKQKVMLSSSQPVDQTMIKSSKQKFVSNSPQGTEKPSISSGQGLQCGICDSIYPNLETLKQHLVSHAEPRPHVCKYCDAGFTTAQSLRVHLRTHKQERPYVCGHCGDTFDSAINLQTHMVKEHSNCESVDSCSPLPDNMTSDGSLPTTSKLP